MTAATETRSAAQAKRRGWKLFGRKDDDQH